MKKIAFKVSSHKNFSVATLIKEVNKISCRIHLDLENGIVIVEDVNDTMIDTVFELINSYYTIFSVDIDNIFEKSASEDTLESEVVETLAEHQLQILEPQSEEDLIIKKVEFQNEQVESAINKLLKTASWAMFKLNIPENEIVSYIYSTIDEMSMNFVGKKCIDVSVGDIVDCNYGAHLTGETNGKHIHAVVCNISTNKMLCLVPLTLVQRTNSCYIPISKTDVLEANHFFKDGFAVLDKAKYLRPERVNSVIGKTTPDFLNTLCERLVSTFDFTHN